MEKLNIYKQAKNMEKANCDLTDIEFFVTLADYKKLKQDKQELENKLDRLEKYANTRSYFDDSRYCCEIQVDLKHILNNEKLNSED